MPVAARSFQLGFIIAILLLTSCKTQNLFEGTYNPGDNTELLITKRTYSYQIRPDDKITLSIWGHDDLSIGSIFGIYNSNDVYGKWQLVDKNGMITFPKLGPFKIGGLTRDEAARQLSELYSEYLVDPIIVVKVLNMQFTVLGGVQDPGTYTMEKESLSLVEVFGRSGGFDFYADRSIIKLIRDPLDNPREYFLDLTEMSEYEKNNILIIPDDIIYVQVKNSKTMDKRSTTLIAFATIISAGAVLFAILN
jgi:polysaccharide export outer membrane protein